LICSIGCCIFTALIGISIIIAEKSKLEANATIINKLITTTTTFASASTSVSTSASSSGGTSFAAYLSIIFIAIYIIFFSVGYGAITETYLSDFFASEARATGCSAATLASLLFRLIVLFSFPMLKVKI
jgi:hypothetical protein